MARKELIETFKNASGDNGKAIQRQILIDELVSVSKKHPENLRQALITSGIDLPKGISSKQLALKSSDALFDNDKFRKEFGKLIALYNLGELEKYSNTLGGSLGSAATTVSEGTAAGGQSGNWVTALIGAAIGATEAGFNMKSEQEKAKAEKSKATASIIASFSKDGKVNWIPIGIILGVLVIGGIVTYAAVK